MKHKKLNEDMTLEQAIEDLKRKPLVPLWPTVGLIVDASRGTVYSAAERGEIECMNVGRLKRAISASLRKKLGIEAA
jgi:hypothetical protein